MENNDSTKDHYDKVISKDVRVRCFFDNVLVKVCEDLVKIWEQVRGYNVTDENVVEIIKSNDHIVD